MPSILNNGVRIAYEVEGTGDPLVLIRGYANSGALWYDQIPALSEEFKVIVPDNRGTGKSDKPSAGYTIGDMASDIAGIIRREGFESAHLVGISMGGMIALQAALDTPQVVKSLVLGCSTCAGRKGFTRDPDVHELFKTLPEASDEENARRSVPALFSQGTIKDRPEVVERYLRVSLENRPPYSTFALQMDAILKFDVCSRLKEIDKPVLILHGERDRLIEPETAGYLAAQIPAAKVEMVPNLGHLFFMEEPSSFNEPVIRFLKSL